MNAKLVLAGMFLIVLRWLATAHVTAHVGGTQLVMPVITVVAVIVVTLALAAVAFMIAAMRMTVVTR